VTGRVCCLRSADGAASTLAVLPQHVDLGQQRDVSVGHVQAVQRVEHLFEAGDGVVAGLGGGNHHQPAVDVGLLVFEGVGPRLEPGMVGVRSVFGVVEVALCIVELLLQQAVLRRDLGQQVVERVQVACGLQLVVEVVGDAGLVVVHLVRLIKSIARGGGRWAGLRDSDSPLPALVAQVASGTRPCCVASESDRGRSQYLDLAMSCMLAAGPCASFS
jgi:hypothetical protein